MKHNIDDIKNYIIPEHPLFSSKYLIMGILLISFFGIMTAICDPITPFIFYFLLLVIILIDSFAIFILTNIEKWQVLFSLFSGINCLALSIVFYIFFYKTIYLILKLHHPILLIGSIIGYVLIMIGYWYKQIKGVKEGYYSREKKNENKYSGIIIGASGGGMILGKVLIRNTSYTTFMTIFAFIALIFSYLMILGTHNIYKYYLMRKYKQYVKLFKLEEKKKTRRK